MDGRAAGFEQEGDDKRTKTAIKNRDRGFPKTSVFGKATNEKACFAAFRRETARGFPSNRRFALTEFWENLDIL
jgi:hypothetical protein